MDSTAFRSPVYLKALDLQEYVLAATIGITLHFPFLCFELDFNIFNFDNRSEEGSFQESK